MSTWITCTPPTPNGPLHLGHMAGPYIAADVLRRALRRQGADVRLTTGIDDNQTYVPRRARGTLSTPRMVADRYTASITQTWRDARVHFDRVVQPRGPGYEARVQDMFAGLVETGAVVARDSDLPFCRSCDDWCHDADVRGGCPHCGATTNGNACEQCGLPNRCSDIVGATCSRCDAATQLRALRLFVLPLEQFRAELTRYWDRVAMPARLRAICDRMAAGPLPEITVAHPGSWGVPVPDPAFDGHRIYVWLEMAEGYAIQRPHDLGPGDHQLVQFFGIDNGWFHAVLMPAVNIARGRDDLIADRFVVNEFFLLNGRKFSTSRGHAVWAEDFLPFAGSDLVRLHCSLDRPAIEQTDFTLVALARTEAVLAEWQQTCSDVLGRLTGRHLLPIGLDLPEELERARRDTDAAAPRIETALRPESFDVEVAGMELVGLARRIRAIHLAHPADGHHGAAATSVLGEALRVFAAVAEPIVPSGSDRLIRALDLADTMPQRFFGLGA